MSALGARPGPAARAAFGDAPWRVRGHVALRWATAPFEELGRQLPPRGEVLDLGCGHGLLAIHLAGTGPGRTVHGVDVDAAKVDAGRRAVSAAGLAERVQLEVVEVGWRPAPESADAVVISDVLYLLGHESAAAVVADVAAAVRPGGIVVVQDTDPSRGWRSRLAALQEHAAVRVLGITAGGRVAFVEPEQVASWLRGAGLVVQGPRPSSRPHPQFVVTGRRPPPG